ncbi:hypothetical protein EPA93_42780 [Ktedonosporobacter rubrisoli]|uniref:Pyridoxamine 5'-phosphate oxidase N-terminal domain-containing protein n=1 Tax=Ktedonosporobacter rubrisoli TaxID=2509675 RepID=A0A4P6K2T7_KTERU|nr:pyridoxamine 5'-phosphate oxidase family protein [Ktedonosporobacter rubrisoli]QBD82345.1 hypothetical protein EPA93_42780 [Ktedonosporobacter rubrisoli]
MLLTTGQSEARTRWRTHEQGTDFDKKKLPYLSEEAQRFIAQQTVCVIGGHSSDQHLGTLLVLGLPGFVQTVDKQTCFIALDYRQAAFSLIERIYHTQRKGQNAQIALFFMCHTTRTRLCVHGKADLIFSSSTSQPLPTPKRFWLRIQVTQAFFHCSKYIRTKIAGLTAVQSAPAWNLPYLLAHNHLSEALRTFLDQSVLCYLCTTDRQGNCGINHRGGKVGFLVSLPPDSNYPKGRILLPDYTGNGAFEAIGNILETGKAAITVPSYSSQLAVCFSGTATVHDLQELSEDLQERCLGAQRVLALAIEHIEGQTGDWRIPLAYECARASLHHKIQASGQRRSN